MTDNIETDAAKASLASLIKIPAAEFEQHFHEWMERDDVARGLQAKLRCDLIKNFNKTNLGKQLTAHSMSATRGATFRLTPLVLALNTLVAEFLYAQDSHFTLSVFCTEIPYRNTLPDFESMRHFRFNESEIREIWDAVTNSSPTKRSLDPAMLDDYVSNPSSSLLLLFVRCLVNQKPQEMFRKSIEVQTEPNEAFQMRHHCSTSVQVSPPPPTVKSQPKNDETISHLNKYLLILSQKVNEMTKEFELLVREKNVPRPQRTSRRSARSREFESLNRSLERINTNVQELTKSKSKNKRLANIVESLDVLTKQFAKCTENFYAVTRELCNKDANKVSTGQQINFRLQDSDQQDNKMEVVEKAYVDWINEMRTTNNGKKFLERIEKSIQKANRKYKEHLEAEAESKLKHMKSLLKMHYKQKLILRLSELGSNDHQHLVQAGKFDEDIAIRLKQFEEKQMELMQQLKDSSLELYEAQQRLEHEKNEVKRLEHEKIQDRKKTHGHSRISLKEKKDISRMAKIHGHGGRHVQDSHEDHYVPKDKEVDQIIKETKSRLRQLEKESNYVEQNFLACLKRRRQQLKAYRESSHKLIVQSRRKTSKILANLQNLPALTESSSCGKSTNISPHSDDLNAEYLESKEKLAKSQREESAVARSPLSTPTSPTMVTSVIAEAKKQFFEEQNRRRQQRAQELSSHTLDLEDNNSYISNEIEPADADELHQEVSYELSTYSWNFIMPGGQGDLERPVGTRQFQAEDLMLKIAMTQNALDDGHNAIRSSAQPYKYNETGTPREHMDFGKEINIPSSPLPRLVEQKNSPQSLYDIRSYADKLELVKETTSDLLKQSMAKMKQLFADTENSKKPKAITFADESEGSILHKDNDQPHDQERNLQDTVSDAIKTTTVSQTTTTTTTTTKTATVLTTIPSNASVDPKSNASYSFLQCLPISGTDIKTNVANSFITDIKANVASSICSDTKANVASKFKADTKTNVASSYSFDTKANVASSFSSDTTDSGADSFKADSKATVAAKIIAQKQIEWNNCGSTPRPSSFSSDTMASGASSSIADTKANDGAKFITKKQLECNNCGSTPRPNLAYTKGYNGGDICKSANLTERLSCVSMPALLDESSSDSDEDSVKTLAEEQLHSDKEGDNTDDDYEAEEEQDQHEYEHEHEDVNNNGNDDDYDNGNDYDNDYDDDNDNDNDHNNHIENDNDNDNNNHNENDNGNENYNENVYDNGNVNDYNSDDDNDNDSVESEYKGQNEKSSRRMENLGNNFDGPALVASPKGDSLELGEVASESQFHFESVPDPNITSESSSRSTNYEMDELLEKRHEQMIRGKTSDDSENDFWA